MKSLKFNTTALLKSFFALGIILSLGTACQSNTDTKETSTIEAPKEDLQSCVLHGKLDLVKEHIAAGTDLNQKDPLTGSSPLITAVTFDKQEIAKALVEGGADLNIQNNDGSTALLTAAFFGRVEMAQLLVNAKADTEIRNNYGASALDMVSGDFEALVPVYQMMEQQLGPLGLSLDYEALRKSRPVITVILQ